MIRARLLLLSLVAALSAVALLASSAAAKISFEWKVNGKALAAGEQRTFTARRDGVADMRASLSGATILLLSNQGKVSAGAKIFGGKPGTGEEILELENVTVDRPANCEVESLPNPVVGLIRTTLLKTEIVEGQTSQEPMILVSPKAGTVFAEVRFLGANCLIKNQEANVTGTYLGLPLPQLTEVLTGIGDEEAPERDFLLSTGGAVKTAGLGFAGSSATITGLVLVSLVSDEKAGVF